VTEPEPTFVGRVFSATGALPHHPAHLLVIVRRPYAHIEDHLRSAFEGRDDVVIIQDRRRRVRRMSAGSYREERRRAERRSRKEDVLEVVIEGYRPDHDAMSGR
jgi:hypothetical protein